MIKVNLQASAPFQREIGSYTSGKPGPTFICMGGLHGNEPAGIYAVERVLASMEQQKLPLKGVFHGLAGNVPALREGVRFLENDINRIWFPKRILALKDGSIGRRTTAEEEELLRILEKLEELFSAAQGEVIFFDLHTSSADGEPFAFIGDTIRNRKLAFKLPLPVILGLEEQLDGGLNEYLGDRGCLTVGIEGGQHGKDSSVDQIEAAIWVLLIAAGMLADSNVPGIDQSRQMLRRAARGVPHILEIRYRHAIENRSRFEMNPGYFNFRTIRKDEVLAHDNGESIRSPENGRILLPLYQALGNDGFFVARPFKGFWLVFSEFLRRIGLPRLVPFLPGVRRLESHPGYVHINGRVARWLVRQVFHLLGFRKERRMGRGWTYRKRCHDLTAPERIDAGFYRGLAENSDPDSGEPWKRSN